MKIKVAAVQMNCVLGDVDANLALAEKLLEEAVAKGAKWVIFPELFNTGYWVPKQDVELADQMTRLSRLEQQQFLMQWF